MPLHLLKDALDALEVDKGVETLGALADLADGLGAAQQQHAEDGLLALGQVGKLVPEGVLALRDAGAGLVHENGEFLVAQALHRLLDRVGAEVDNRLAVARLVAGRVEAVEGQRILVRSGRLLFEEAAEDASLLEGEKGGGSFGGGFREEVDGFFGHGFIR